MSSLTRSPLLPRASRSRSLLFCVGGALLLLAACRPQAPKLKSLPRLEVPFDGVTDGKNPAAEPVPEARAQPEEEPAPAVNSDLPDPKGQSYESFFRYTLQFAQGDVSVLSTKSVAMKHPTTAPRKMGRFAVELFVGSELLERVRFDFPLLGAARAGEEDPIEKGLTTQMELLVPLVERATWARVLDRKTRKTYPLSWPPGSKLSLSPPGVAPGAGPGETGP